MKLLKTAPPPKPNGINGIADLTSRYFHGRRQGHGLSAMNEIIRDLRIMIHQVLIEQFLALPLPQARDFRFALADQLYTICKMEEDHSASEVDKNHHRYCVQEILSCFEWAEQIKEEIPDDPLTQKILAIDIPILRPFHYDLHQKK